MAYTVITLTNDIEIKKVPIGFSWTTLFFGFFVPLWRQDLLTAVMMFLAVAVFGPWPNILFSFFYNYVYAKLLFAKGFKIDKIANNTTKEKVLAHFGYIKFPNE